MLLKLVGLLAVCSVDRHGRVSQAVLIGLDPPMPSTRSRSHEPSPRSR
jgi:hypothetical protein